MSNYVNDALLDASPYKKQQEEAKALVNKWDKTGLLDGLNEDFQRSGMAVMLENQARQLIQENSATGGSTGGTAAASNKSSDAEIYAVVAKVSKLKGLKIRVIGNSLIISKEISMIINKREFLKKGM